MKVFIARNIPNPGIEKLEQNGFEVIVNTSSRHLDQQELIKACLEVDFLLNVGHAYLDDYFFQQCPHLKGIALASVGYDHVDLAAATKANVPVSNTPGVLNGATADIALLLMLAVSRKAFYRTKEIDQGKWKDFEFTQDLGQQLDGKTLGIYGLGRIGMEFARKAKAAFGMEVIYHNRSQNEEAEQALDAHYVDFETLLAQSDVLSVHTNLSPETEYKFDATSFQKMKSSAIFINTARGKIHHEQDLITALKQGEIWGAGLDVTDPEPMHADNPLLNMPNVCVLPHIGSATLETRTDMVIMAANNLIEAAKGLPMSQIVNTDIYS